MDQKPSLFGLLMQVLKKILNQWIISRAPVVEVLLCSYQLINASVFTTELKVPVIWILLFMAGTELWQKSLLQNNNQQITVLEILRYVFVMNPVYFTGFFLTNHRGSDVFKQGINNRR